jgi:hypothetical protein
VASNESHRVKTLAAPVCNHLARFKLLLAFKILTYLALFCLLIALAALPARAQLAPHVAGFMIAALGVAAIGVRSFKIHTTTWMSSKSLAVICAGEVLVLAIRCRTEWSVSVATGSSKVVFTLLVVATALALQACLLECVHRLDAKTINQVGIPPVFRPSSIHLQLPPR